MNAEASTMHRAPLSRCAYCHGEFEPKRPWSAFCSTKCRADYDLDIGTEARVRRVSKIKRGGVAVTLHLTGPSAERALNLDIAERVLIVKPPCAHDWFADGDYDRCRKCDAKRKAGASE